MPVPVPTPVLPSYRIPIPGTVPLPVPLATPVPVIPGNAGFAAPPAAAVADSGGTLPVAPATVDEAGAAPPPAAATGEAPRPRLRRAGEFLRRPKVQNGITDFLSGATGETTGGPVAAFLQGMAGAWGSKIARSQAQAAAEAAAEQLAYDRGRDAREDALADSRLGLDRERLEHDRATAARDDDRLDATAEAGIYKTAAEIRAIEAEARQVLSNADIIRVETAAADRVTELIDVEAGGFATDEQIEVFQRRANDEKAETYRLLIDNANGIMPGAAAGATGPTPAPAPFVPPAGITGDGTIAAPYSGPLTNEIIAAIPITDPPQRYVVGGVVYERRAVP